MYVKDAVAKASDYLPEIFTDAQGQELRLEGVEKTDDGRFWAVAFSYVATGAQSGELSRDYKTVKIADVGGEFVGARNGVLLGVM